MSINFLKMNKSSLLTLFILINILKISFSQEKSSVVTDIDGNVYKTVKIGTQIWMQENLKVTHYNNGDEIETLFPDTINLTAFVQPKFQWVYQNVDSFKQIYGRLYTWYVVMDNRKLCPEGWHVPTDEEFCILENYLEPGCDPTCSIEDHGIAGLRGKTAGNMLKEAGHRHWDFPETGANNKSGFTGLPAGIRYENGEFLLIREYGYFWTSTEFSSKKARTRRLYYDTPDIARSHYFKKDALSVRCVKDE